MKNHMMHRCLSQSKQCSLDIIPEGKEAQFESCFTYLNGSSGNAKLQEMTNGMNSNIDIDVTDKMAIGSLKQWNSGDNIIHLSDLERLFVKDKSALEASRVNREGFLNEIFLRNIVEAISGEKGLLNIDINELQEERPGQGQSLTGGVEDAKERKESPNVFQVSPFFVAGPEANQQKKALEKGCECITLQGKAFANPTTLLKKEEGDTTDGMKAKVEELQICLLECAMEYEIKILEMKMKMLHKRGQHEQQVGMQPLHLKLRSEKSGKMDLAVVTNNLEKSDGRCLDYYRDQMYKLRREKDNLTKEVSDLRKRERQYELQRRNLQEALNRVNWLQREMAKKEDELVDCQLREKEATARLHEIRAELEKAPTTRNNSINFSRLLPALSEWLQSLKKIELVKCDHRQLLQVQSYETSLTKIMEECLTKPQNQDQLETQSIFGPKNDKVQSPCVETQEEVQALEKELEKLACRR